MLRTFIFLTADTQYEVVATGFRDACLTFERQTDGKVPVKDILAMEEHYPPSGNDTASVEGGVCLHRPPTDTRRLQEPSLWRGILV